MPPRGYQVAATHDQCHRRVGWELDFGEGRSTDGRRRVDEEGRDFAIQGMGGVDFKYRARGRLLSHRKPKPTGHSANRRAGQNGARDHNEEDDIENALGTRNLRQDRKGPQDDGHCSPQTNPRNVPHLSWREAKR